MGAPYRDVNVYFGCLAFIYAMLVIILSAYLTVHSTIREPFIIKA